MTRRSRAHDYSDATRHTAVRFEGLTADDLNLAGAIVSGCTFVRCDLTGASLKDSQLSDCRFEGCELGMIDLTDAAFSAVHFDTCRLSGVRFEFLNQLPLVPDASFEGCDLSFCSFRNMDLTACAFVACRAWEAEFLGCQLNGVDFSATDFARCTFARNDLSGADLRTSRNYVLSPLDNNLRGARVSLPEAAGVLLAVGLIIE